MESVRMVSLVDTNNEANKKVSIRWDFSLHFVNWIRFYCRFETVFYLVGLNEQTKVHVESDEVKGSLVRTLFCNLIFPIDSWFTFLCSGAHQPIYSLKTNLEIFGCRRRSSTNCLVWIQRLISIDFCHLQKHEVKIHRRRVFSRFTTKQLTDCWTVILATISIRHNQLMRKHLTISKNTQTKRAKSVVQWQKICIASNRNHWATVNCTWTSEILTIIWVRNQNSNQSWIGDIVAGHAVVKAQRKL